MEISLSLKSDYPDQIKIGRVRERRSRNYEVLRVYVEVEHIGLKASKEISGADEIAVQQRFNQLVAGWDKKYTAFLEKEQRSTDKASAEKMDLETKNVIAFFLRPSRHDCQHFGISGSSSLDDGYDEPEILPYQFTQICPMSADARH